MADDEECGINLFGDVSEGSVEGCRAIGDTVGPELREFQRQAGFIDADIDVMLSPGMQAFWPGEYDPSLDPANYLLSKRGR